MGAAKDVSLLFHAMAEYPTATMRAGRRQGVNRAFETVKSMAFARHSYFKSSVVVVSARLTFCHIDVLRCSFDLAGKGGRMLGIRQRRWREPEAGRAAAIIKKGHHAYLFEAGQVGKGKST